jgi:hypothetical protein
VIGVASTKRDSVVASVDGMAINVSGLFGRMGQYSGAVPLDVVAGEAVLMQVSGNGDWPFTLR